MCAGCDACHWLQRGDQDGVDPRRSLWLHRKERKSQTKPFSHFGLGWMLGREETHYDRVTSEGCCFSRASLREAPLWR